MEVLEGNIIVDARLANRKSRPEEVKIEKKKKRQRSETWKLAENEGKPITQRAGSYWLKLMLGK